VGDRIEEMLPDIVRQGARGPPVPRAGGAVPGGEAGIRQFLDIGTGLPTADNTHQVAQRVAPESKIVYVDNDPWYWRTRGPADQHARGDHRLYPRRHA